jgi:hypothetical protein
MAAWRREALKVFPELKGEINPPRKAAHQYTYYSLFFDLYSMYREAHKASDDSTLKRLFNYAEWCFHQARRSPDMNNALCVCFYERVFEIKRLDWSEIAPRLSPSVVQACWPLWEGRFNRDEIQKLRDLLEASIP